MDNLDEAYEAEERAVGDVYTVLKLRILLLKAKLFETKLSNAKQAMSIYSKCLLAVDQDKASIAPAIKMQLKNEIKQAIKNCGGKIDQSINFSEKTDPLSASLAS